MQHVFTSPVNQQELSSTLVVLTVPKLISILPICNSTMNQLPTLYSSLYSRSDAVLKVC